MMCITQDPTYWLKVAVRIGSQEFSIQLSVHSFKVWIDGSVFYIYFISISVMIGQEKDYYEKLSAMKCSSGLQILTPAGFNPEPVDPKPRALTCGSCYNQGPTSLSFCSKGFGCPSDCLVI